MSQSVWGDNKYQTTISWDDLSGNGLQSDGVNVDASGISTGFHTFGLLWSADKIEWFYDGQSVRTVTDPNLIPNQYNLYPRLESQIVDWLVGGPSTDDPWPAECKFDYYRHFVFDQIYPACQQFDLDEMAKCEAHYLTIADGDDYEYKRLIMENCPCHINCYRGCGNCGTWECEGREFVDPATPANSQPDGVGNEFEGKSYELVYSDEFNGALLNTNKWHLRDEAYKVRKIYETGQEIPTVYEPKHNYVENGSLVQQWVRNPDPSDPSDPLGMNPYFFSSGRVDTNGIFSPIYGWFEARLDTVPTNGVQTAWWMWPDNGLWNYDNSYGGEDHCPDPNNAWWGSEIDIIEARKFDDFCSTNIHYGGYKGPGGTSATGCYAQDHTDEPVPGLHDGFHTLGLRWSNVGGGRLEWFYDGTLIRTLDDPLKVSRAATFWILSTGVFTDPDYMDWNFVDGNAMDIPLEDFPLKQYIDYVRVWREVDARK